MYEVIFLSCLQNYRFCFVCFAVTQDNGLVQNTKVKFNKNQTVFGAEKNTGVIYLKEK